jgi:hypothetical protein
MLLRQSNKVDEIFSSWHDSFAGHNIVYMPPGWKKQEPIPYTFIFTHAELSAEEYVGFFEAGIRNDIHNVRLFTPRTFQYTSCFHPSFYQAVRQYKDVLQGEFGLLIVRSDPLSMTDLVSSELNFGSVRHWLQSVVFLAGVTLSAAIIQNRWSVGTLESKLNRLWQLEAYSGLVGLEFLKELRLKEFVLQCAAQLDSNPAFVLKELKLFYSAVLKGLVKEIPYAEKELKESALSPFQAERFGFVKDLKMLLGTNIQCILLYGSATNSLQFADYDLIIVVKNLSQALDRIAGKSPKYNGLELNICLFDEADFMTYQLASGDNLADHALCLYGSATVPHKPLGDLVARNYSFGFVRFRQLMGMAAHVGMEHGGSDDKRNLIDYFIKIPLNVFKGIQGCYGKVGTNEEIKAWSAANIGFDVNARQQRAREGFATESVAHATWATQEVMHWFDKKNNILKAAHEPETSVLTL